MTPPPILGKSLRNLDAVRAITYARQSKAREDDSRTSPEGQRAAMRALVDARGYEFVEHYEDVGRSGFDPSVVRPGFNAMLAAVRRHECDVVVIAALSRLTRQGAFEAMTIERELADNGVSLVSVDEPFLDTSTPIGVAIFALIAGLAQQESVAKSEMMRRTQATVRSIGGHVVSSAPYGLQSERTEVPIGDGKHLTVVRLVPHPVTADIVRRMVAEALAGSPSTAIARRLNEDRVPTPIESSGELGANRLAGQRKRTDRYAPTDRPVWRSGVVSRILRDPRIAGFSLARSSDGWTRSIERGADGQPLRFHQGIIEPGEFYRLQDILDGRRPEVRQKGKAPTLLSGWGILFCAECQRPLFAGTLRGERYYRCSAPAGAEDGHKSNSAKAALVDDEVARRTWIRVNALDIEDPGDRPLLIEASRRFAAQEDDSGAEAERAEAQAALEYTRAAFATLHQDRLDGAYDGTAGKRLFLDTSKRLQAEEERLEAVLRDLAAQSSRRIQIPDEWVSPDDPDPVGPNSAWAFWDLPRRRAFLSLFIDRIEITKPTAHGRASVTEDRVRIRWAGEKGA